MYISFIEIFKYKALCTCKYRYFDSVKLNHFYDFEKGLAKHHYENVSFQIKTLDGKLKKLSNFPVLQTNPVKHNNIDVKTGRMFFSVFYYTF